MARGGNKTQPSATGIVVATRPAGCPAERAAIHAAALAAIAARQREAR